MKVESIAGELQRRVEALCRSEIARYGGRLCDEDRRRLEKLALSLCRRFLREPVAFLNDAAGDDAESEAAADFVCRLFALD